MDEHEKKLVEEYLADVVERLFDVTKSLEALNATCNVEKIDLIRHGQSFAYQQGILDVTRELLEYAVGERNLVEDMKDMMEVLENQAAKEIQMNDKISGQLETKTLEGMFQ